MKRTFLHKRVCSGSSDWSGSADTLVKTVAKEHLGPRWKCKILGLEQSFSSIKRAPGPFKV